MVNICPFPPPPPSFFFLLGMSRRVLYVICIFLCFHPFYCRAALISLLLSLPRRQGTRKRALLPPPPYGTYTPCRFCRENILDGTLLPSSTRTKLPRLTSTLIIMLPNSLPEGNENNTITRTHIYHKHGSSGGVAHAVTCRVYAPG